MPSFLDQEPPPGYVAGVGRGATGFSTSADSALPDTQFEGDEGLLATLQDDDEAEQIYLQVEERLQKGKKTSTAQPPPSAPAVTVSFSALKRDLAQVTDSEWQNLPDAMDFTRRNKRLNLADKMLRRFYAAPDLQPTNLQSHSETQLSESTPNQSVPNQPNHTNFAAIAASRDSLLLHELDKYVPLGGMDTARYLEGLEADVRVADVDKTRAVLSSLRRTEPMRADSWIASARLEEEVRNWTAAKRLIRKGCEVIPRNEEVWLENVRLHAKSADGTKMCRSIVTDALKHNPHSVKLWTTAVDLEDSAQPSARRRILMRALEALPHSTELWHRLVAMEDGPDAKKLLDKAVELCPNEWSFWARLVGMCEGSEAREILNRARKALPRDHRVWLAGAKLEEGNGNEAKARKLAKKAVDEERRNEDINKNEINGESTHKTFITWAEEATSALDEGHVATSDAIISASLEAMAMSISEILAETPRIERAAVRHSVYRHVARHADTKGLWVRLFDSVKSNGDSVGEYYRMAIDNDSHEALYRMMYAKDEWVVHGNVDSAREILDRAAKDLPDSEPVWLARVKLEIRTGNFSEAYAVSKVLIERLPATTPRVWYKHIHLVRFLEIHKRGVEGKGESEKNGKNGEERGGNEHKGSGTIPSIDVPPLSLCDQALSNFPENHKLHLQKAQVLRDLGRESEARDAAMVGTRTASSTTDLWLLVADLDAGVPIKARATVDSAIAQASDARLWKRKIELEIAAKNMVTARQLSNKALQQYPVSAELWVQHLELIPKMLQRKNAFLDALKKTDNSPVVLTSIGVFFWLDGKHDKAKSWFERAVTNGPRNGDSWGWLYAYEARHGDGNEVKQRFVEKYDEINEGLSWNHVNKAVTSLAKLPEELLEEVANGLVKEKGIEAKKK